MTQARHGIEHHGIYGGILAAGRAERLGVSKSFVKLGSEFLIERAVKMFLNAGVEQIIVAIRSGELDSMRRIELLRQEEKRGMLRFVFPEPGTLLGASIQCLYGALQGRALVVHQVDRPFVPWQWIVQICQRYEELGQVVATVYQGCLMPPVLLPAGLQEIVQTLNGDFGLREALLHEKLKYFRAEYAHQWPCQDLATDLSDAWHGERAYTNERVLGFGFDCDTVADLRLLLGEFAHVEEHGKTDAGNKEERLPGNEIGNQIASEH